MKLLLEKSGSGEIIVYREFDEFKLKLKDVKLKLALIL